MTRLEKLEYDLGKNLILKDGDGVYICHRGPEVVTLRNTLMGYMTTRYHKDGIYGLSFKNSRKVVLRYKVLDLDGSLMP